MRQNLPALPHSASAASFAFSTVSRCTSDQDFSAMRASEREFDRTFAGAAIVAGVSVTAAPA
jgi:hypothetical protein